MKKDENKTQQLLLYKQFFSKQYDHPVERIDVEYFIVKRKLYENCDFPQKRIQQYRPAAGKPAINKVDKLLKAFVENVFNADGTYNKEGDYPAYKNDCTYCPFKKEHDLCPPKSRILKPC